MQIKWKKIENGDVKRINDWLSCEDKHNLCMEEKGWMQTANDIEECLNIMPNAEFKNIIGYVNGKPVVAVMFGVEQIEALNLYNIVVNPKCRHMGVAKEVVWQLLAQDKSLKITKSYNKVMASALPNNDCIIKLFKGLNFNSLGFDGEYIVFEKNVVKTNEKVK